MGILEQISEQMLGLINEVKSLNNKVDLLEGKLANPTINKAITLGFDETDTVNVAIASKILRMTQGKFITLVKNNVISSSGKRKKVFLISELIRYKNVSKMQLEEENKKPKIPSQRIQETKIKEVHPDIITADQISRLIANQAYSS